MKDLIISIHDVTPYFLPELKVIFQELDKLNIKKYNLLIVPNWDNKYSIKDNPEFISLIKKHLTKETKITLHGFTHKSQNKLHKKLDGIIGPSGVIEYASLNEKEAEKRIIEGLKLINDIFEVKPIGFVPPAWIINKGILKIIQKHFKYYTTYSSINYFNHKIKSISLCYTGGGIYLYDKLICFLSSLMARFTKNKIVCVAIHPDDVRTGNFQKELKDIESLMRRGYKLSLYEDFN